jgi:hypothetical protein
MHTGLAITVQTEVLSNKLQSRHWNNKQQFIQHKYSSTSTVILSQFQQSRSKVAKPAEPEFLSIPHSRSFSLTQFPHPAEPAPPMAVGPKQHLSHPDLPPPQHRPYSTPPIPRGPSPALPWIHHCQAMASVAPLTPSSSWNKSVPSPMRLRTHSVNRIRWVD